LNARFPAEMARECATPANLPWPAKLVLRRLHQLDQGALSVGLPCGTMLQFGTGQPQAEIVISDWSTFSRILRHGDIGFAHSFLDQHWHTPHLGELLALFGRNRRALSTHLYGSRFGRMLQRLMHAARANTRSGSRRNIAAHYDLGNEFYALWLDPGMTYSSALFGNDSHRSLQAAQQAKYGRILDQLAPAPGAHILEIGCGWGGFAETAAAAGCQVTALSLSQRQLDYARARLQGQTVAAQVSFEYRDYRDVHDRYDAVVSIEMFEAVGERWWPAYFAQLASALARGGKAVIQTIVIADELFGRYRTGSDFIQQYIFPGGMLPCPARFCALARAAGLEITDEFRFGADYARTLAIWHERFLSQLPAIRAQGFDERFVRMWEFYLSYCEAGFTSGSTDVIQYTLVKT